MALFDGFFDAEYNAETNTYDREYNSGEFTEYFEHVVGTGVCVHNDPDSFLVRLDNGAASVSPGYLFISGYWLRNTEDYRIELDSQERVAVAAQLDMGRRMIDLTLLPASGTYTDTLILAYINPASGTVEDTRYNTDICGAIDSAGGLNSKITFALEFIDTEVEQRLDRLENKLLDKEKVLDRETAKVMNQASKIEPLPIGSIKFSANPNMGEKWLECDGSFIRSEYPELIEILQKLPLGKGHLQKIEQIRLDDISNAFLYSGRIWFYCDSLQKLYGVSVSGGSVKEISVKWTGEHASSVFASCSLSFVTVGSSTAVYFVSNRRFTDKISENNQQVSYLVVFYGYSSNFNASSSSITVTGVKFQKKISELTGNAYKYLYDQSRSIHNIVMGYGGQAYLSLGTLVLTNLETIGVGATAVRYIVTARMNGSSSPELTFTQTDEAPAVFEQYLGYRYNLDAYAGIPSTFSIENNGCIYFRHSYGEHELLLRQGITDTSLGKTTQEFPSLSATGALETGTHMFRELVTSGNHVLIQWIISPTETSALSVKIPEMSIGNTGMFPVSDYSASEILSSAHTKNIIYLNDVELWACFTGTGLLFTGNLSDKAQYTFYDTRDIIGALSDDTSMLYSNRKLYVLGRSNSYIATLFCLEIPEGYSPLDGAFLPKMSMDGVPAYIKAREG